MNGEQEDLRVARHLIEQLSADCAQRLDDPAIHYWRRTSPSTAGDLLAACRAPGGALHVVLIDIRGGGWPARVGLLSIVAAFLRMTEKGYSLPKIVRELNRKARQAGPADFPVQPVAAQAACVDHRAGIVSLWNGDMPIAFMLDGAGHHFQEFPLVHAALGLFDDDEFDDRLEQRAYLPGDQLVMVSDGLLEAVGTDGLRFGERGLAEALVGLPGQRRREEVLAAVEAHLAGSLPADDMTLVLIDCAREAASRGAAMAGVAHPSSPGSWRFDLRLGAEELRHVDVVPLLLDSVSQFEGARECGAQLFVILSELFNNALDHGLLRLDSRLKRSPDGLETWLLLREERLMRLAAGELRLSVEQFIEDGQAWLRVSCRDSGPGFDVRRTLERLDAGGDAADSLPFGRGLTLLRRIADHIEFAPAGNGVVATLAVGERPPR